MDEPIKKEEQTDFETIFFRAEASEKAFKFNISSNHYYTLLTKLKETIPKDVFENIKQAFKYNIFFLSPSSLKDKFLSYILNNDSFVLTTIELVIFKKFLNKEIIFDLEAKPFFENMTENIKILLKQEESLIEKTIFEHNIYSISLLYENISLRILEKLLDKKEEVVGSLLFKMIIDGRIKGKIDEIEGFLIFNKDSNQVFDSQVKNFCSKVILLNEIK
jgi:hypothetical protein